MMKWVAVPNASEKYSAERHIADVVTRHACAVGRCAVDACPSADLSSG